MRKKLLFKEISRVLLMQIFSEHPVPGLGKNQMKKQTRKTKQQQKKEFMIMFCELNPFNNANGCFSFRYFHFSSTISHPLLLLLRKKVKLRKYSSCYPGGNASGASINCLATTSTPNPCSFLLKNIKYTVTYPNTQTWANT